MSKRARIAPPNSLLVVSDIEGGDAPKFIAGESVLSTPSCITVGCLTFADGETEVRLAPASEFSDRGPPKWDQVLETPSRVVAVSTVMGEVILEEAVREVQTRVRIWGNRFPEPDEVFIGLG
jgi:hypothetical protein